MREACRILGDWEKRTRMTELSSTQRIGPRSQIVAPRSEAAQAIKVEINSSLGNLVVIA